VKGRHDDAGSASVWVLTVCALLLLVGGAVQVRTLAVLARHRAESAADFAALAGAVQIGGTGVPCTTAARVAAADGARLVSCVAAIGSSGRSGSVTVHVDEVVRLWFAGLQHVTASARAARDPPQ
jgi:secretion/DNA translocation related TadE-like protein